MQKKHRIKRWAKGWAGNYNNILCMKTWKIIQKQHLNLSLLFYVTLTNASAVIWQRVKIYCLDSFIALFSKIYGIVSDYFLVWVSWCILLCSLSGGAPARIYFLVPATSCESYHIIYSLLCDLHFHKFEICIVVVPLLNNFLFSLCALRRKKGIREGTEDKKKCEKDMKLS